MESFENEIEKYKSLLDQINKELNELKTKYEEADKTRLVLGDDLRKSWNFIENIQQYLDDQDEITKSVNAQIFETKKENIKLESEKLKLQNELQLKEKQLEEMNGKIFLINYFNKIINSIFNYL